MQLKLYNFTLIIIHCKPHITVQRTPVDEQKSTIINGIATVKK